LLVKLSIGLSQ